MEHLWSATFPGVYGGEVQTCQRCWAVRSKHLDGKNWRIEGGAPPLCPGQRDDEGRLVPFPGPTPKFR